MSDEEGSVGLEEGLPLKQWSSKRAEQVRSELCRNLRKIMGMGEQRKSLAPSVGGVAEWSCLPCDSTDFTEQKCVSRLLSKSSS